MANIIEQLESEQMQRKVPSFAPGDTVVVQVKVKEGTRERLQAFEGVVIAKRNRGLNSAFTVRKISHGEGVERVFQTYSPIISDIEVKRRGDVRREPSDRNFTDAPRTNRSRDLRPDVQQRLVGLDDPRALRVQRSRRERDDVLRTLPIARRDLRRDLRRELAFRFLSIFLATALVAQSILD